MSCKVFTRSPTITLLLLAIVVLLFCNTVILFQHISKPRDETSASKDNAILDASNSRNEVNEWLKSEDKKHEEETNHELLLIKETVGEVKNENSKLKRQLKNHKSKIKELEDLLYSTQEKLNASLKQTITIKNEKSSMEKIMKKYQAYKAKVEMCTDIELQLQQCQQNTEKNSIKLDNKTYKQTTASLIKQIYTIQNDVSDLWYYIKADVNRELDCRGVIKDKLRFAETTEQKDRIGTVILSKLTEQDMRELNTSCAVENTMNSLSSFKARKEVVLNNIKILHGQIGTNGYVQKPLSDLETEVQHKFLTMQSPQNCEEARKLVCKLSKPCGFGCQFHELVHCFHIAYAIQRTAVLEKATWTYSKKEGWEKYFKPLANNCDKLDSDTELYGPTLSDDNYNSKIKVLRMPMIEGLYSKERLPFLLPSIPRDIAQKLSSHHRFPFVWWVGQIVKYLFRLQPAIENELQRKKIEIGYTHPIVGVHVRRTDKLTAKEASFHGIEEYMLYVEEYFDQMQFEKGEKIQRQIYLSTDDPHLLEQTVSKYPHYHVICNNESAKLAEHHSTRYTDDSFTGLLTDLYLLAHSDHMVGTFSSQTSRVAYEWMQSLLPRDASANFNSLDDVYYFGGSNTHYYVAIENHTPRKRLKHEMKVTLNLPEVELKIGDLIKLNGNFWNGYSVGVVDRTKLRGVFPSYKVKSNVETAIIPLNEISDYT